MKKILLIALLSACQSNLPKPPEAALTPEIISSASKAPYWTVFISVPEVKRGAIVFGVQAWAKTGLPIFVTDKQEGASFFIHETELADQDGHLSCGFADDVACSNPDTGEMKLIRGEYEHNVKYVIMHELGHLLIGRGHLDGTIMQARPDPEMWDAHWECPDSITVARAEKALGIYGLQGCKLPRM